MENRNCAPINCPTTGHYNRNEVRFQLADAPIVAPPLPNSVAFVVREGRSDGLLGGNYENAEALYVGD